MLLFTKKNEAEMKMKRKRSVNHLNFEIYHSYNRYISSVTVTIKTINLYQILEEKNEIRH